MEKKEILKYKNKKVMLTLLGGSKITCVIPDFEEETFVIKDKYNSSVTIDCRAVLMIYELNNEGFR